MLLGSVSAAATVHVGVQRPRRPHRRPATVGGLHPASEQASRTEAPDIQSSLRRGRKVHRTRRVQIRYLRGRRVLRGSARRLRACSARVHAGLTQLLRMRRCDLSNVGLVPRAALRTHRRLLMRLSAWLIAAALSGCTTSPRPTEPGGTDPLYRPAASPSAPNGSAAGQADGGACLTHADCASGICEGLGCTDQQPGTCAPRLRACTRDLRIYCGCDGVVFKASGSCPGRRYQRREACSGGTP
jgi:hypothetical protein